MTVNIVKGNEQHFPEILALIKELAVFEKAGESVVNTLEQMVAEQDNFEFFVAIDEAEDKVVGMALYFFAYYTWVGKSLYLDDLFVNSGYRGQGIAKRLLAEIFNVAHESDCKRVRWQVLDWNEPAISLYKKMGANLDPEWINCDFDQEMIAKIAG